MEKRKKGRRVQRTLKMKKSRKEGVDDVLERQGRKEEK